MTSTISSTIIFACCSRGSVPVILVNRNIINRPSFTVNRIIMYMFHNYSFHMCAISQLIERWEEESCLMERFLISCNEDVVLRIHSESRNILLELRQFDSRFRKFV